MVLVNGLIFGLLLSVLIGPVFFTLLQTSIEKGFEKAILVAIGIFFSDLFYINLAYFGLSQVINAAGYKDWISYAGGAILVIFGIVSLFKSKSQVVAPHDSVSAKGFFRFIIKGFVINGISPFVLVFWIGAMSMATLEYSYHGKELILFFGIILLVVLLTDIVKAYLAGKLRRLITPKLFKILNVGVGLTLIAFGIRMFVYSW